MLLKMFRTPEFWYKTNIKSKLHIILFYPFSILWVLIDALKNYFSKTYKSKLKVICVGNLTVGGTGTIDPATKTKSDISINDPISPIVSER